MKSQEKSLKIANFIFQNGIKNADFVLYNPMNIKLKDENPIFKRIKLETSDFWNTVKSLTWSVGCRFFFVLNEDYIIIGNTYDNESFLCNLSMNVFEEYLNYFKCKT